MIVAGEGPLASSSLNLGNFVPTSSWVSLDDAVWDAAVGKVGSLMQAQGMDRRLGLVGDPIHIYIYIYIYIEREREGYIYIYIYIYIYMSLAAGTPTSSDAAGLDRVFVRDSNRRQRLVIVILVMIVILVSNNK